MKPIKVLVVDDSVFIRVSLSRLLEADPDITVLDFAKDGREAVEKVKSLRPDVVTLDVIMPVMDGLTALKKIMKEQPTPVVMLSSITRRGAQETIASLAYGAIDFIPKPLDLMRPGAINKIREDLITKVKTAAGARVATVTNEVTSEHLRRAMMATAAVKPSRPSPPAAVMRGMVVIGASTGGPAALQIILAALPSDFPMGIVIVQHIAAGFSEALAERLNSASRLQVKIAGDIEEIKPGVVLLAQVGRHIKVKHFGNNLVAYYSDTPAEVFARPSIDVLFQSAAENCRHICCGVILSGMGSDGAHGLKAIHSSGGYTLAQDKATSVIFGMAKKAIELKAVDKVLPIDKIAAELVNLASRRSRRAV